MTNSESLMAVVAALGGTATGTDNAGLLADVVTALGGTPSGTTNAELIAEIAAAYEAATDALIASNIKEGVTILGVTGTYEAKRAQKSRAR